MGHFRAGAEAAARRCVDVLVAARVDDDGSAISAALARHGEEVAGLDADDVAGLRGAAARLDPVADAVTTDEAAARLGDLLAGLRPPRLTNHGGTAWHLHADTSDDAGWDEWFTSSSALALATLLVETQDPPMGRCAAPGCENPYLTLSPGRRRRYCSERCATRARVAGHRGAGGSTATRRRG